MSNSKINTTKNEIHYIKMYQKVDIRNILGKINNLNTFLSDAVKTDTSWVGLYYGDFLKSDLPSDYFNIVVGKAFVHHLTHEQEIEFTEIIVRILKTDGIVRYFEPAINSKFLDELRWMTPVPGRPSKFQKEKFAA